jgi:hypothetical protein
MGSIEKWLKRSAISPFRIAGEVLFGTWGEGWEEKKMQEDGSL